jgi:hypothetical protein
MILPPNADQTHGVVCGDIDAGDAAVLEEQRESRAPVRGMATDLGEIALAGDAG